MQVPTNAEQHLELERVAGSRPSDLDLPQRELTSRSSCVAIIGYTFAFEHAHEQAGERGVDVVSSLVRDPLRLPVRALAQPDLDAGLV